MYKDMSLLYIRGQVHKDILIITYLITLFISEHHMTFYYGTYNIYVDPNQHPVYSAQPQRQILHFMKCISRQMPFHNLEMSDTKRISKKCNGQKI